MTIEPSDLDGVLKTHQGNQTFSQALEAVQTPAQLLRLLGGYVHFNATFGGGVANLAGEIAVRQDLFRDKNETVTPFADRSMDIASDIFAAAVDEFDDSATSHRDTHRSLAQATLKSAGQFFGCDDAELSRLFEPNETTLDAVRAAHNGYGVNQSLDANQLFRAVGFHIGSEVLADEEFHVLDGYLRRKYPDLVGHLEAAHVFINGQNHAAYFWIHIHTSVEADHFAFAVAGANRALQFYTGANADEAKKEILSGVSAFAHVQAHFMTGLQNLVKEN